MSRVRFHHQRGFNPTLVRLRQLGFDIDPAQELGFQSHAGSIEALLVVTVSLIAVQFQSHAGSIEAGS